MLHIDDMVVGKIYKAKGAVGFGRNCVDKDNLVLYVNTRLKERAFDYAQKGYTTVEFLVLSGRHKGETLYRYLLKPPSRNSKAAKEEYSSWLNLVEVVL